MQNSGASTSALPAAVHHAGTWEVGAANDDDGEAQPKKSALANQCKAKAKLAGSKLKEIDTLEERLADADRPIPELLLSLHFINCLYMW